MNLLKCITNDNKLTGTLYVKEKTPFGFHLYHIFEPDVLGIGGKNGIVSEVYYNLRDKKYWIKRDLKNVIFNERNIDPLFPIGLDEIGNILSLLSTDENRGMYEACFYKLGCMDYQKID